MMRSDHVFRRFACALIGLFLLCSPQQAQSQPAGGKPQGPGAPQQPRVQVATATVAPIREMLNVTGESTAPNTIVISPTVDGPISFCPWREGDTASAGEALIRISRPLHEAEVQAAEAAVAVAKAQLQDLLAGSRVEEIAQVDETVRQYAEALKFAESDFARTESLSKKGAIAAELLEKAKVGLVEAKTRLASAKERVGMMRVGPTKTSIAVRQAQVAESEAKLALAKAKLAECAIAAPFDGVITQVWLRAGDMASAKSRILEFIEARSQVVRVAVPEKFAAIVQAGQAVTVTFDALPDQVFSASVSRLFPQFDPKWRTRTIEISLKESDILRPNMFARVSIILREVADAVVIPDSALIITPQKKLFVVVVENGVCQRRPIETGIRAEGKAQIVQGVTAGEAVVVTAPDKLKDGQAVTVFQPPAKGGEAKGAPEKAGSGR